MLIFEIFLVLFLVALNGFFVAAEFAFVKVRSAQLMELADSGDKQAILSQRIIRQLDAYLSATQVGITLASLALGWVGEPVTEALLAPIFSVFALSESLTHTLSFAAGFFVLTVLHIVLGELLPKSVAISYELPVSLKVAWPLNFFYKMFRPLIWMLNKIVNVLLRLMGLETIGEQEGHTREELKDVILESARRGIVERREGHFMESLFEFREKSVREVMVHRSDVVAINLDAEPREIFRVIETEGFSRLPVYHNSIDEITGVLHVKDLLPHFSVLERLTVPRANSQQEFVATIERAVRPALFVSETQSLSRLLFEFQKYRVHMAIIASEHGGVEGIVTLEDVLEELVGEIRDESDAPAEERDVIEIGEMLYVNPSMSVSDFNARYGDKFCILEESPEYQTISGFVQKTSGKIPNVGDVVEAEKLRFTITRKVRHKLQQIKIERVEIEDEVASEDTNTRERS